MADRDVKAVAVDLALAETRRGLEEQEQTLRQLRERAGKLVTVAVALAAFLGFTLEGGSEALDVWGGLTIACVILIVACAVYSEWPRKWCFHLSAKTLLGAGWLDLKLSLEYRQHYTSILEDALDGNEDNLGRCHWAYRLSIAALGLVATFLVISLST